MVKLPLLPAAVIVLAVASLSGCETWQQWNSPPDPGLREQRLLDKNHGAANQLLASVQRPLSSHSPLIVTTVANLDNLQQSAPIGRLVSAQVSSAFTVAGFRVHELRLRDQVVMREKEGEFMLSRDVRELAQRVQAQAVMVGTYTWSPPYVYITLRLVEPDTGIVLGAHDYALTADDGVPGLGRRLTQW